MAPAIDGQWILRMKKKSIQHISGVSLQKEKKTNKPRSIPGLSLYHEDEGLI